MEIKKEYIHLPGGRDTITIKLSPTDALALNIGLHAIPDDLSQPPWSRLAMEDVRYLLDTIQQALDDFVDHTWIAQ